MTFESSLVLLLLIASVAAQPVVLHTLFVDASHGADSAACGVNATAACASVAGAVSVASALNLTASSLGLQLAAGVYEGPLNCGLAAQSVVSVQGQLGDRRAVAFVCPVLFVGPRVSSVSFVNDTSVASTGGALTAVAFLRSASLSVLDNATLVSVADSSFEGDSVGTAVSVGANARLRVDNSALSGFDIGVAASGAARVSLRNVTVSKARVGIHLDSVAAVQAGAVTIEHCHEAGFELVDSAAVFSAGVETRDSAGFVVRGASASLLARAGLTIRRAHGTLLQISGGADAKIDGLTISNCTALAAAVGVAVIGSSTLELSNSLITSISGPRAALSVADGSSASLTRVVISDNNATAIFVSASLLLVTDSIIARNAGRIAGALVARVSSDVTLVDTRIFGCKYELQNASAPAAGAIFVHDSSVELKRCALDSNGPLLGVGGSDAAQQIRCVALSMDAARVLVGSNTQSVSLKSVHEPDARCSPQCDWTVMPGSSIGSTVHCV
jgi:hypothetical protein